MSSPSITSRRDRRLHCPLQPAFRQPATGGTSIGIQVPGIQRYPDFLGGSGLRASYKVTASDRDYRDSDFSNVTEARTAELTDEGLLTMVEEASILLLGWRASPLRHDSREHPWR